MKFSLFLSVLLYAGLAFASTPVTGLWTTVDDETNTPKSVVYVYDYQGKIYGRVVKLFKNPQTRIAGLKNPPLIVGSDIIWDMKEDGDTFNGGMIMDPKKGKTYRCEMWIDKENLIVRGKIGPFGRNQTWIKNSDASLIPADQPIPVYLIEK